jgi:hypothetical protein
MCRIGATLLLVAAAAMGSVAVADSGVPRAGAPLLPDLSGRWRGVWWGAVTLRRVAGDSYAGTYTDTYGKDVGRLWLWYSRRSGAFEGFWSEGAYRFGRLAVRVPDGKSASGTFSASAGCEHRPGWPVAQAFRWTRSAR